MSRSRSLYLILTLVMIAVLSVVFVACNISTDNSCEHEYSYVIKQLPTMDADGSMTVTCSKCDLNEEIVIPSLSDMSTWSWKVESKQSSSCEQGGIVVYTSVRPYGGIVVEINTEARGHVLSELIAEVPSTCTVHGVAAHKECSECGKYFDADGNEIESLELPLAEHKIGELIPEVPSTCISHGVAAHKECSECGKLFDKDGKAVESLELPLAEHKLGSLIAKVEPTCSSVGTKAHYVCSVCGVCFGEDKNKLDDLTIPVIDHEYDDGKVIVEATCYSVGTKQFSCKNCDHVYYEDIAKVDHKAEVLKGFAATCYSKGLTDGKICSVCGEILEAQQEIAALEHKHELTQTIEPSCICEGYKYYTCSECGDIKIETIEKTAHIPAVLEGYEASCESNGLTDGEYCSYCGHVIKAQEVIQAKGHSWDDGVIDEEPTCTEVGSKLYTCEHCGETKYEEIKANGHTHEKVEGILPTCTVPGLSDGEKCSVCGEILIEQKVVSALGHDWSDGETLVEADCIHKGEILHECSRCEASYIEYVVALGHKFSETWSYDGANHFHKCDNCDVVSDKASHVDNNKDHKCDVCGYVMSSCVDRDKNHSCDYCGTQMGEHKQASGKHTCDYCGEVMSSHKGGTATCKEAATCEICGQKYGSKDPANHVGHIVWVTDDTYHQEKWECCNLHIGVKESHDLNDNNVCTICGHGCKHSHTVHTDGLEATCTEPGHIEYWTCSDCSTKFSDSACTQPVADVTIPAKGHSLGSLVSAKEANCTEAGYHAYYQCSVCSVYFDVNRKETTWANLEIEALGHNSDGNIAHKDANCTESGVVGGTYCTRCNEGKAEAETVIEALGHKYGNWIDEISATCEKEGTLGHYHCSECNIDFDINKDILTNLVINKADHTPADAVRENEQDATCTDPGHYDSVVYCSVCHHEISRVEDEIPAKGHSYGDWIVKVDATCAKEGTLGHYHCSVCEKDFDADKNELSSLVIPVDSNAHTWSNAWSVDEAYHWHECVNCGEKKDSAEHSFGKDGQCTVCHAEKIYLVNGSNYITSTEYTYTNSKTGVSKIELTISSNKDDAVKLVKRENADGSVTFITFDGKYLYTDGTDVKFVDSEGEYTLFELESTDGGYLIKSLNAKYNNKYSQYLEVYGSYLTVYSLYSNSDKTLYTFKFENVDHICSSPVKTEAKDATCTEPGNKEYWKCSCGKIYSEEACENELSASEIVIPAIGHKDEDGDGKCDNCGEEVASETTVSVIIKDYATANSWDNGTLYDTIAMDSNISVTAKGGSNTGKYYTSGNQWRIYQGETPSVTLSANEGYTIVSVKITYVSEKTGVLTLNGVNVASATVVEVNNNSVTFSVGNTGTATNGQARITAIEVTYKASSTAGCNHNYGEWIKKVDATCSEAGTLGHYQCSVCKKYFDADYKELSSIVIEATGNHIDSDKDGKCDNCGAPVIDPANPEEGSVYYIAFTRDSKIYYIDGNMANTYYFATVEDIDKVIKVYVESTDGGYYLYVSADSGETKQYINIVKSDSYTNAKYEDVASSVWVWDDTLKTLKTVCDSKEYVLGAYTNKTFTTLQPVLTTADADIAQFVFVEKIDTTPQLPEGIWHSENGEIVIKIEIYEGETELYYYVEGNYFEDPDWGSEQIYSLTYSNDAWTIIYRRGKQTAIFKVGDDNETITLISDTLSNVTNLALIKGEPTQSSGGDETNYGNEATFTESQQGTYNGTYLAYGDFSLVISESGVHYTHSSMGYDADYTAYVSNDTYTLVLTDEILQFAFAENSIEVVYVDYWNTEYTATATKEGSSSHTCVYDQEVVDVKYLKSAATCTEAAVYYKSCSCGEFDANVSETFTNGSALGHNFGSDGKCQNEGCSATANIVYLDTNIWNVDNAWFAVYYWNDNGSAWSEMTIFGEGSTVYYAMLPDNISNIIFVRMNVNKHDFDWASKDNQSQDITLSDGNSYYVVKDWNGSNGNSTVILVESYTLVGTGIFGGDWNVANSDNDLVYDAKSGLYTKTYDVNLSGTVEYKIAINHNWYVSYGWNDSYSLDLKADGDDNNFKVTLEGVSKVTFTFNIFTLEVKCEVVTHTHTWELDTSKGEQGYEWNANHSECIAYGKCSGCDETIQIKATITSEETKEATCKEYGVTTYTATFAKSWATTQTEVVVGTVYADHNVTGTVAKDATCTEDGNIAYWYCSVCEKYFTDEACSKELTDLNEDGKVDLDDTVIKSAGHKDENPADGKCDICGEINENYYYPKTISELADLEDGTKVEFTGTVTKINYNWSASASNMSVTVSDGNGKSIYIFKLATKVELCDEITVKGVIAAFNNNKQIGEGATATIGDKNHVWKDATCTDPKTCTICGKTDGEALGHKDENGDGICDTCKEDLSLKSVTIAYTGSTTTNMSGNNDAKSVFGLDDSIFNIFSTKTGSNHVGLNRAGNIRLYYNGSCALNISVSDGYEIVSIIVNYNSSTPSESLEVKSGDSIKSDEDNVYSINANSVVLYNTSTVNKQIYIDSIIVKYKETQSSGGDEHVCSENAVEYAAVPATCLKDGTVAYWSCSICNNKYSDKDCTKEITDIVDPKKSHSYTESDWVNEVPAKCNEDGVKGHYYCSTCEKNYDKDGNELSSLVISKTGEHNYVGGVCTVCGKSQNESTTVKVVIADYASVNSWSNGTLYETIGMDSIISVTAKGTSNTGKFYDGSQWRIYQTESPSVTVSAIEGYTISSVKITYTEYKTGVLTLNGANVDSDTTVEVNNSSVTFSVGNTGTANNGQARITAIEVVYKSSSTSGGETHTHNARNVDKVNATCEAAGNIEYWYCSGCDKYFTDEACTTEISKDSTVISALGHDYGTLISAKNATCTDAGNVAYYQCSVCKLYFNENKEVKTWAELEIDKKEHTYNITKHDDNQHWNECSCGKKDDESVKDHAWDEGTVTKQPTESEEGERTYTCSCGATKTEPIEKLPHTHVYDKQVAEEKFLCSAATCQSVATYYYSCSCGEKGTKTFEYGELGTHNYTNQVNSIYRKTEATCESPEVYYTSCVYCKNSSKGTDSESTFDYGVAKGHDFNFDKTQSEDTWYTWSSDYSTCTAHTICQRIGCTETKDIPVDSTIQDTKEADCTNPKVITYTAVFSYLNKTATKEVSVGDALGHIDENKDHKCDREGCEETLGVHEAQSNSHNCAYCGQIASEHTYDNDHKCTVCGEEQAKIYLATSANWRDANAWFAAYFWNSNNENEYGTFTAIANSYGDYECYVPDNKDNVIIIRMSPNDATPSVNDNENWGKTGDLSIPTDGNNCYKVVNWNEDGSGWISYETRSYWAVGTITDSGWTTSESNKLSYDAESGVWYRTFNGINSGDYEFKVLDNYGTWFGAVNGANITFNVAVDDATVTIKFNSVNAEIKVDQPDIVYTLNDSVVFAEHEDNQLKAVVSLNRGAYLNVKDQYGNSYSDWENDGFLSDDNTVIHSGEYTLYLKLDTKKIYVAAPGHNLGTLHSGQEGNCLQNGWDAYYLCECGTYFDENKNETTWDDLYIAPVHQYSEISYEFLRVNDDPNDHENSNWHWECTATRECTVSSCSKGNTGHTQTAISTSVTQVITQRANCQQVELSTLTATFDVDWIDNPYVLKDIETAGKTAHSMTTEQPMSAVAATCTSTGLKQACYYCSVCEKYYDSHDGSHELTDVVIAIDENAHDYGEWVSNGDGTHTRTCIYNSKHTVTEDCTGGTATCTEQAECIDCHAKYGEVNSNNHSFTNYVSDNNATCEADGTKSASCDHGCGKTDTIADDGSKLEHTYDQEIIDVKYLLDAGTCTTDAIYFKSCKCGKSSEGTEQQETFNGNKDLTNHTKDGVNGVGYMQTADNHKQVCKYCQETIEESTEHTWVDGKCSVCEYQCSHQYSKLTTINDAQHQNKCDDCGLLIGEPSDHVLDNDGHCSCGYGCEHTNYGEVTYTWNTDYTTCYATHKCSNCEHTESAETKDINVSNVVYPTCITDGSADYSPEFTEEWAQLKSGETIHIEFTQLGHEMQDVSAQASTCTEPGWNAYQKCSRCTYNTKVEIPALGHDTESVEWSSDESNHWKECQTCGEKVEVSAHDYNQEKVDSNYLKLPATCTAAAVYYKSCTCGATGSQTFEDGDALGHDWTSYIADGDGTHTLVCSHDSSHTKLEDCYGGTATCKAQAKCELCKQYYGSYGEHTYGDWIDETPATCTETGTKGHKECTVCHKNFDNEGTEIDDLTIAIDLDAHYYEAVNGVDNLYKCSDCSKQFKRSSTSTWELLTDDSKLSEGSRIIIVGKKDETYYALSTNQKTNNRGAITVTKNANESLQFTIDESANENVQIIIIVNGNKDGTYAFNVGSKYLYAAGNADKNNYLRSEETLSDNSSWTIAIYDSVATITAQGTNSRNLLQYNSANELFSCYASNQQDVYIYIENVTYTYTEICENSENHTCSTVNVTGATCTEDGVCSICGRTVENSALGHEYTNYTYNNDATCMVAGTKTAYCDHGCGESNTLPDSEHPATGHSYDSNGKCTNAGCTAQTNVVYLETNGWNNDNAHIIAHFFGEGDDVDLELSPISNNSSIYYVLAPNKPKVVFVRTSTSTIIWDSIWNQSQDITLSYVDQKAHYTMTNWKSNGSDNSTISNSYKLVGTLPGIDWDTTNTNNEFSYNKVTGLYTRLIEITESKQYEYKILIGDSWDYGYQYSNNGTNFTVSANAGEQLIFTYDFFTKDIKVETHTHNWTLTDNKDGTHTKSCTCGSTETVACSYNETTGLCECGALNPAEDFVFPVSISDIQDGNSKYLNHYVTFTGTVTEINYAWSSNSMSVMVSDGDMSIYVYKLATQVERCDEIAVTGIFIYYENENDTSKNMYEISSGSTATIGEKKHVESTEWSKDSTTHYHICTVCNTKLDSTAEEHTYGDNDICTVCNYEKPVAGSSVTTTVDLSQNFEDYANSWNNSYTTRTVDSSHLGVNAVSFSVEFEKTAKQTQTIKDVPVMNPSSGNYITITPLNATITKVSFSFKEWTTKKTFSKIWIQYTTDGSTWIDSDCNGYSGTAASLTTIFGESDFTITTNTDSLPEGVTAVRLFVKGSNIGISHFSITTIATSTVA